MAPRGDSHWGAGVGGASIAEAFREANQQAAIDQARRDKGLRERARSTTAAVGTAGSDLNSEVIGLDQSIAYASSLATLAGEHGMAGNEGYIGHLTGQKVAGDALRTASEMQEAFSNAAAAAEAHAAELTKQKQVQEAYDANPDAGDKQFQTEGR